MHESVHIGVSPFAVKTNRFHRCVETDFVAELEAVSKRFLRAVDAHAYTVEFMDLDSFRKRLPSEPVGFNRRVVQPGSSGPRRRAKWTSWGGYVVIS